jgi:glycosyltransferase involved in cell wall biosynthesis
MVSGKEIKIFVILGRLGINLSISKLAPICHITSVDKVFAFREFRGINYNQKLRYIIIPSILLGIKPAFFSRILRMLFEPVQILVYAFRFRPDLINGIYTLPKGLNSFLISRLLQIPCVISVIGGREEIETEFKYPLFWKKLNLFMLKNCELITCKGQHDIDYLIKEGITREKIFIYNGGIDTSRFKPKNILVRPIDILFVGRFDSNKGAFRVIEIIKNLIYKLPELQCIFLGDGQLLGPFRSLILSEKLENNIQCLGFIDNPEEYYGQAKVFVLPSTNEGLSTAMLEAMSCGCVPIVSNVGNLNEAVINGETGFIIENYDDIQLFSEIIFDLLSDNVTLNKLSLKAMNKVETYYSYSAQALLYESIVKNILNK